VAIPQAARERLRAEDQRLDRQVCPLHDLTNRLERASGESTYHEQVDVTSLVLIASRQRAEHIHSLDAQLGAQAVRETL
jgi:hypothetical protein